MATRTDLFGNTLSPNTVTGGSRITFSAPSSSSSSKSKKKTSSKSLYGGLSDYSGYNTVTTSGGSYSASGVRPYTVTKADISGLLKAYEDQAASARNTAQTTYDTTRNDLLTSLKRFVNRICPLFYNIFLLRLQFKNYKYTTLKKLLYKLKILLSF